jgi:tRNA(Ile2)-agmatinylcytidine synthase
LVARLIELGSKITGYPRLVRLNPNVPFKTRGNAAVAVEFECESVVETFEEVCSVVEEYSDVENGANSGLVFLDDSGLLPFFTSIYERTLAEVVNKRGVMNALSEKGVKVFTLGNGMGVVGAAAGIGFDNSRDHTYELLAYRKRERCGTPRAVDRNSVKRMDRETFPRTFNNYDYQRERVLITPHGPDPVFLGIRGDSPQVLLEAFRTIEFSEDLEGHTTYISNQCTDAHLSRDLSLPLKAYSAGRATGKVSSLRSGDGGHLYFDLETSEGSASCAVYEPAGDLRKVARLLVPGDVIEVAGGVRRATSKHESTINVERIHVLTPARRLSVKNPRCGVCGTRMKSEGNEKGFQCRTCGRRASERETLKVERALVEGIYLPSARARRHLTKPLIRYGRETEGESLPLVKGWFIASEPKLVRVPARSPR